MNFEDKNLFGKDLARKLNEEIEQYSPVFLSSIYLKPFYYVRYIFKYFYRNFRSYYIGIVSKLKFVFNCEHNGLLGRRQDLWIRMWHILEIHYDICSDWKCAKLQAIRGITLFDKINFNYDEFLGYGFYID